MREITIDFIANKIVVTKGFYENAKVPATEENDRLRAVLSDYPNMKVSVRECSRKNKPNAFKGLTYRYMRKFISVMDYENLDTFERVCEIAEGKQGKYAVIKKWFLNNYKEAYEKELENLKLERELDELAAELEDVA